MGVDLGFGLLKVGLVGCLKTSALRIQPKLEVIEKQDTYVHMLDNVVVK